jgi:hypothetical protein
MCRHNHVGYRVNFPRGVSEGTEWATGWFGKYEFFVYIMCNTVHVHILERLQTYNCVNSRHV